ncbi:uncharacterized protein LOC123989286 [Osmia bicornis bicornis]|uniref:uncharacterized protein LOC123989286 n=1 Tax=Osmia bicornis bicornis TaxID=1437191 RepID=UPI001EAED22E|nr:uncharacterized protein LOC123989286 [Osmia bicornis bicornis]
MFFTRGREFYQRLRGILNDLRTHRGSRSMEQFLQSLLRRFAIKNRLKIHDSEEKLINRRCSSLKFPVLVQITIPIARIVRVSVHETAAAYFEAKEATSSSERVEQEEETGKGDEGIRWNMVASI